jgi:hypothetical protein
MNACETMKGRLRCCKNGGVSRRKRTNGEIRRLRTDAAYTGTFA